MSPLRLIILVLAAAAAIASVFFVRTLQAPSEAAAASAPVKVEQGPAILVAKKALHTGQLIANGDLGWQSWPENAPVAAFITREADAKALETYFGAVVRTPLVEGEPITAAKLVKQGEAGFMAAMLTPGMRAVSIAISAEAAAGGFVLPGDRVDLVLSRELEIKAGGETRTTFASDVVFENVRVLAIDTIYATDTPPTKDEAKQKVGRAIIGKRATLELSKRDAELLEATDRMGRLSLHLRSLSETEGESGATWAGEVLAGGGNQLTPARVRVYRNGAQTSVAASPE